MKLDKEIVVKHQFWFLLGSYLLVWLVAVLWLKVAAGGPIKAAEKKYKDSKGKLDKAKQNPKNPNTFCPPWREYGKVFDGHKRGIWGKAWDLQRGMYNWPFSFAVNTPQTEISQDDREKYQRELYPNEIKKLKDDALEVLGPVELAGGFEAIYKPQKWTDAPSREECWLTQEDYWVKRDLLYVIGGAVGAQAYMYPVEIDLKKEPQPADVVARHRFRNLNWEITLLLKKDKDKNLVVSSDSTLKNVHPGRRTQVMASAKGDGIVFNVYQQKLGKKVPFIELKGEPVPWDKSVTFGSDHPLRDIDWTDSKQTVYVSQAFDWQTCPIRRIEAIEVGQQSCRTYTTALKANDTLAKLDAPTKEAPPEGDAAKDANSTSSGQAGAGIQGGTPPGGMMGGSNTMQGSRGMGMTGGAAAANVNATPNNSINRNRYLQAPRKAPKRRNPAGICRSPFRSSSISRTCTICSWRWPTHACAFRSLRSSSTACARVSSLRLIRTNAVEPKRCARGPFSCRRGWATCTAAAPGGGCP